MSGQDGIPGDKDRGERAERRRKAAAGLWGFFREPEGRDEWVEKAVGTMEAEAEASVKEEKEAEAARKRCNCPACRKKRGECVAAFEELAGRESE